MTMSISAFGDEIASDFEEQLQTLQKLKIGSIDVRGAWDVNCSQFTADHIQNINTLLNQYEISVACMGSPIGKSPIQDPIEVETERLKFIADVAHQLGTKNIRIFSFYPEADVTPEAIENSIQRLQQLTDLAKNLDVLLLLENEKGLVGDTPERMLEIFKAVDSEHIQLIWDPANFVQCGAEQQVENWWDDLNTYIGYIHIKDALLADGTVKPAGEGDGQIKELLAKLHATGYAGVLALEPHLAIAGHSSGFSGADGMEVAVTALRKLMDEVGIQEG